MLLVVNRYHVEGVEPPSQVQYVRYARDFRGLIDLEPLHAVSEATRALQRRWAARVRIV